MEAGIVFDLDDTLIRERDYVASGFRAVAQVLAERETAGVAADDLYRWLWRQFESGQRGSTFDALRECFQLETDVATMVDIYRQHKPQIEVDPLWLQWINAHRQLPMAIVSDGPLASQQRKVDAVAPNWANPVILTDSWGREFWKPHPRAFQAIQDQWRIEPTNLVYIADNPSKDFVAPNRLGWYSIQLCTDWQVHGSIAAADGGSATQVAGSVSVAIDLLNSWLGRSRVPT